MKWGRSRSAGNLRAPMLAGWLFADLLLVLFITAFTSLSAPPPRPTPSPTPTATPTHSPTPKPTKTSKPEPRVLETKPHSFTVNDVNPADVISSDPGTRSAAIGKMLGELHAQIVAKGLQGRQAGFVIVLAYGPMDGIGQALTAANSVVNVLKARESQFSGVAGLGYWSGSAGFEFKIFFFA